MRPGNQQVRLRRLRTSAPHRLVPMGSACYEVSVPFTTGQTLETGGTSDNGVDWHSKYPSPSPPRSFDFYDLRRSEAPKINGDISTTPGGNRGRLPAAIAYATNCVSSQSYGRSPTQRQNLIRIIYCQHKNSRLVINRGRTCKFGG
jgi:hypothetical protein